MNYYIAIKRRSDEIVDQVNRYITGMLKVMEVQKRMKRTIRKTAAVAMAVSTLMTGIFGMTDAVEVFADVKVPLKKIALSKTSARVREGKSFRITVSYTPDYTTVKKKVKWSSSKKSVAVVKNGKVIAKKPGNAMITAKVGGRKAKCRIKVIKKPAKSNPVMDVPVDERPDEDQKDGDQSDDGTTY